MKSLVLLFLTLAPGLLFADSNPYQIGSTWGKIPVSRNNIQHFVPAIQKRAYSVAKFLGGSAFYLGKFEGRHIMATNYHVLPKAMNCGSIFRASFSLLKASFSCKKFILALPEIELSLFEIKVPAEKEAQLQGLEIELKDSDASGKLFGLGHGAHLNPDPTRNTLLLSQDEHCKSFASRPKFINDPDTKNPVTYKVWSLPIGCDFSHGDSGAPVFNELGEFAGIFWTGAVPKASYIQNDTFLATLDEDDHPAIWSKLSYMVPVPKIRQVLENFLFANPIHPDFDVLDQLLK